MVQLCAFLDPNHQTHQNHQIPGVCVQVFRFSSQVWHSCLGIQAQYSVCVWVTHIQYSYSGSQIQVYRFRYSGLEFRFGYTDWVYRLADKYKALTFSIHIQGIQVHVFTFRHSGLGIQVS